MTQPQLPFPSDPDPSPQPQPQLIVPTPRERYLMRAMLVPQTIYQVAYVHYGCAQKKKLDDLQRILAGMVDKGFIYIDGERYITSEKGITLLPENERIAAPEFFSIPVDEFNMTKAERKKYKGY